MDVTGRSAAINMHYLIKSIPYCLINIWLMGCRRMNTYIHINKWETDERRPYAK
ncbi:hypothetical protein K449DRAFT_107726 [Hypoxylon sp. EC38]|nr:hypothetical protein K449DRAFT_107726 [Hypoxylon sp. EC38]